MFIMFINTAWPTRGGRRLSTFVLVRFKGFECWVSPALNAGLSDPTDWSGSKALNIGYRLH
jgi:hypothetical protein